MLHILSYHHPSKLEIRHIRNEPTDSPRLHALHPPTGVLDLAVRKDQQPISDRLLLSGMDDAASHQSGGIARWSGARLGKVLAQYDDGWVSLCPRNHRYVSQ